VDALILTTEVTPGLVHAVLPPSAQLLTWASAFFMGFCLLRMIGGRW
jgi:hypothetical protein